MSKECMLTLSKVSDGGRQQAVYVDTVQGDRLRVSTECMLTLFKESDGGSQQTVYIDTVQGDRLRMSTGRVC